jgi:hypothetical protein
MPGSFTRSIFWPIVMKTQQRLRGQGGALWLTQASAPPDDGLKEDVKRALRILEANGYKIDATMDATGAITVVVYVALSGKPEPAKDD